MPGVSIRTATRSGPASATVPESGRYFVAAQFERGRTDVAQLVRSAAELEVLYGGRVSYGSGYDDLRTFFEEGGAEAYVIRVVGPAATTGTLTLSDRAGVPLPTIRLDARGAGAWSTGVTVAVEAGTLPDTFRIRIDGPLAYDAEVYDNLDTVAGAVAAINARSRLVTATDLGSATAAPNNRPAILAATALSAGSDDRAALTANTMTAALAKFGAELGTGAVAVPGYGHSLVGTALIAHAKANRRLALIAPPQGTSVADAIAAADGLVDVDGEHGGLFYPWVTIPTGGGTTKLISPEGYVAAMRARAHTEAGPWRAPAGEVAVARYVTGTERVITREDGDALDEAHVSAVRTIAGTVRLYGWRSLSTDEDNYALLTGRDVLNTVAQAAEERLERFVFQPIDSDGRLLASVAAELVGIVDPYRAAGGLYARTVNGEQLDPGYSIDVGPTVNTEAVLRDNTIAAVLALRVSPVGSLIDLTIVKAGLTAAV